MAGERRRGSSGNSPNDTRNKQRGLTRAVEERERIRRELKGRFEFVAWRENRDFCCSFVAQERAPNTSGQAVGCERWGKAPSARPDVGLSALRVSRASVVLPIFPWGICPSVALENRLAPHTGTRRLPPLTAVCDDIAPLSIPMPDLLVRKARASGYSVNAGLRRRTRVCSDPLTTAAAALCSRTGVGCVNPPLRPAGTPSRRRRVRRTPGSGGEAASLRVLARQRTAVIDGVGPAAAPASESGDGRQRHENPGASALLSRHRTSVFGPSSSGTSFGRPTRPTPRRR
jgi:hypothetical protein